MSTKQFERDLRSGPGPRWPIICAKLSRRCGACLREKPRNRKPTVVIPRRGVALDCEPDGSGRRATDRPRARPGEGLIPHGGGDMSTQIQFLGLGAFRITLSDGRVVLIDPCLEKLNPVSPLRVADLDRVDDRAAADLAHHLARLRLHRDRHVLGLNPAGALQPQAHALHRGERRARLPEQLVLEPEAVVDRAGNPLSTSRLRRYSSSTPFAHRWFRITQLREHQSPPQESTVSSYVASRARVSSLSRWGRF